MTSRLTQTFDQGRFSLQALALITFACWVLPISGLLLMGKNLPAAILLPLPLIFAMLVSPTLSFYLFMLTVPIYFPYHLTGGAIWAFDLCMAMLLAGLVLQFMLKGETEIRRTPADLPMLMLVFATWLSALFAYRTGESLIPSIRILVIFLAFRAIFTMANRLGVRRIVQFYIYLVAVLSVINIAIFLYYGGAERVFGPAWLAFENYSMTALPMALAFFIWSKSRGERVRFALVIMAIAMAIIASGSRGTLVAVAMATPILIWIAWRKINRDRTFDVRYAFNQVLAVAGVITAVIVGISGSLLVGFFGRVEEMFASVSDPQGSIALRIVLWTAAVKGWLTSPLVGIGIGNFNLVDQVVPSMKTAPVWYYIKGMSAHNVVLHYLAETGIIGVTALLAVTGAGLRMARAPFREVLSRSDTQVSAALMIAMIVFALSIFFMRAWTWAQEGYVMAMIFGMTAAWWFECKDRSER